MDFDLWLAFLGACTAFMFIPGPTIALVVGYALGRGPASGWATVPGVLAGDVVAMTASLAGVGAALAASDSLFRMLTLAGSGYIVWLGIRMWRTRPSPDQEPIAKVASNRTMFLDSFVVTALNPKSIVFFVAFLPQFVDRSRPLLPQFAIMEATFLALGGGTVLGWLLLAGYFRHRLQSPAALLTANRVGATLLITAGILTAALRHSP